MRLSKNFYTSYSYNIHRILSWNISNYSNVLDILCASIIWSSITSLLAGVLALGMNFGAYGAEVFRAGILAVPKGQWEGATALNLVNKECRE